MVAIIEEHGLPRVGKQTIGVHRGNFCLNMRVLYPNDEWVNWQNNITFFNMMI